ncbi:MAG: DNA alkylation repair protein [Clostridia bacterium]|nr:DNA alkylation repair protein [Clostridia bacterium]
MEILDEILKNSDSKYKDFQGKLLPTIDEKTILGLRAPKAQAIAKKYANTKEGENFLSSLPHKYYDENIVHAFMLGKIKASHEEIQKYLLEFLPYVDNWAVCDGLVCHLKSLFKNKKEAYPLVLFCLDSKETYTVRFGLVCLLNYYITDDYIDELLKICSKIKSEEYYVNMALAWLVSFMLIKKYEESLSILKDEVLDAWVHNKAIQKTCESFRISDEQRSYLKTLRR